MHTRMSVGDGITAVAFLKRTDYMQENIASVPNNPKPGLLDGVSPTTPIEIANRRYVTADGLAAMLGVTVRTLSRWDAARIGPPKIRIGKKVLFDLAKLPDWLATHETEPVRASGRSKVRSPKLPPRPAARHPRLLGPQEVRDFDRSQSGQQNRSKVTHNTRQSWTLVSTLRSMGESGS